jgi:hypothetical protein
MRQTTPRRLPAKIAVNPGGKLSAGAGDHLDLGMIVSVYCAGSAHPSGTATSAEGGPADVTPGGANIDDTAICFTEH